MTVSSAPTSFAQATKVTPGGSPASFTVDLHPEWTILGKPNGGYLLAVLANAVGAHLEAEGVDHRHAVAATASYGWVPECGPSSIEVSVLRSGKSTTQATAQLRQGGEVAVAGTFTFQTLQTPGPVRYRDLAPLELAPEEECVRLPTINPSGAEVAILGHTAELLDPTSLAWTRGASSDEASLKGWVRFDSGEEPTPASLLYVCDCFPPATFAINSLGWVPTLQLTAYVRALPAPGPLQVHQFAQVVDGGLVDEVCHVFDSTGRLVAQGTQLAMVRFAEA